MYVRITRGTTDPAQAAEVESISAELAAAFAELPGFLSYQAGLDRRTGAIVSITTWESEKAAHWLRESLGDLYRKVLDLAELEATEIYEVITTT